MLDRERIKLMTQLATFEQREDRQVFRVNSYMRNDYVTLHVIYTLFATSLAYLLICAVVVASRYNYVLANLNNTNIIKLAGLLLGSWVILELVFGIIAFVFYTLRYKKCKNKMNTYIKHLKKLDQMYENGDK